MKKVSSGFFQLQVAPHLALNTGKSAIAVRGGKTAQIAAEYLVVIAIVSVPMRLFRSDNMRPIPIWLTGLAFANALPLMSDGKWRDVHCA